MSRAVRCIFRHLPLALRNAPTVHHGTEDAARSTACGGAATEWFTQTRPHSTQYAVRSTQYAVHSAEAQRRITKRQTRPRAARSTQHTVRRPSDGVDYTAASKERGAQSTQCGGPATEWITKRRTLTTQHAPGAEVQRRSGLHSDKLTTQHARSAEAQRRSGLHSGK
jgi:hypothetical protein